LPLGAEVVQSQPAAGVVGVCVAVDVCVGVGGCDVVDVVGPVTVTVVVGPGAVTVDVGPGTVTVDVGPGTVAVAVTVLVGPGAVTVDVGPGTVAVAVAHAVAVAVTVLVTVTVAVGFVRDAWPPEVSDGAPHDTPAIIATATDITTTGAMAACLLLVVSLRDVLCLDVEVSLRRPGGAESTRRSPPRRGTTRRR